MKCGEIILDISVLKKRIKLSPTQVVVGGFAIVILIGAILLNLPVASRNGESIGIINAFFTSTSAVCVTGLVVVDTGTYWTSFGHVVIITLIQIGGLGFMTFSTLFALLIGRKITLKERLLIQESLNRYDLEGLVRLTKNIIIATFLIELVGAFIYSTVFIPQYGFKQGIAFGVFHSISAFCNAGFDLIGDYKSFTPFVCNTVININTMLLIVVAGLGFSVWIDLYYGLTNKNFSKLSLHTKVVLTMTIGLIVGGALFFFIAEINNSGTIKNLPLSGKILAPIFHSVTPRTAGYNTIDMASLTMPSKFMTIILMFIGGSPGSTAGGVKTATVGLLIFTILAVVRGREDVEIFERKIPKQLIYRALSVALISFTLIIGVTMILSITEKADFMTVLFEATSAFGTVGLSLNYTPQLSVIGKIIIALTMFAGRVGPLSLIIAFSQMAVRNKNNLKYPEERILVG